VQISQFYASHEDEDNNDDEGDDRTFMFLIRGFGLGSEHLRLDAHADIN